MTSHLYSPLNASTYQFRILRLLSGAIGNVVQCELQIHNLIKPPRFIALSYCWGDERARRAAVLNGIEITITENLEEALQQLRSIGIELIWVDALCINQNDIQERSLQVRLMKQIYTKADATYAWIGGPGSDNAARALAFLEQVLTQAETFAQPFHNHDKDDTLQHLEPTSHYNEAINAQDRRNNCRACYLESSFEALLALFQRSYWQRRWIIQEVATAKRTLVLCNGKSLILDKLSIALRRCRETIFWTSKHDTSCRFFGRIERLRDSYHNRQHLGLFKTMLETKNSLSKEKRDQIFALLGICADGESLVPIPNYEETLESVMINLTKELLRRNGAFEIILIDQRKRADQKLLPSWCPDWLTGLLSEEAYSIAEHPVRLARSNNLFSYGEDPLRLRVQGLKLGSVVAITTILNTYIPFEIAPDTLQPQVHPAQHTRYYGSATIAAVSACLYASTKSPQRVTGSCGLWPSAGNLQLYMLLQSAKYGSSATHGTIGIPHWRSLYTWLIENKAFVMGGDTLHDLMTQRLPSTWFLLLRLFSIDVWVTTVVKGITLTLLFILGFVLLISGFEVRGTWRVRSLPRYWDLWGSSVICFFSFILLSLFSVLFGGWRDNFEHAAKGTKLPSARLIVLDTGAIAIACSDVRVGDSLCFIAGCESAAVLRPASRAFEEELHTVVGRAFACVSKRDSKRYKAFCELSLAQKGVHNYETIENTKEYNRLIETYKAYEEWKHFVLI